MKFLNNIQVVLEKVEAVINHKKFPFIILIIATGGQVVWDLIFFRELREPRFPLFVLMAASFYFCSFVCRLWEQSAYRYRTPVAILTAGVMVADFTIMTEMSLPNSLLIFVHSGVVVGVLALYFGRAAKNPFRSFKIKEI